MGNPGDTGGLPASGVPPQNTGGQAASATLNLPDSLVNKLRLLEWGVENAEFSVLAFRNPHSPFRTQSSPPRIRTRNSTFEASRDDPFH